VDRLLLVDDNKTLAKLIAKKITSELGVQVDVAYNLAEAKLFLHRYKYLLTLLDVNLPDAPDGEVIDYTISKGQKVIVLSGNDNREFRHKMLEKNIIDYVNKQGKETIQYLIYLIKRIQKNQNHKILVVDDVAMFRKKMEHILTNLNYKVITVAHGEEALGMLETHPDVSLAIVDYVMPVMNGLDLTMKIREKVDKNSLQIIALSSSEDDDIIAKFLKSGANDYITKPFSKEEFSCRINNSIEALENIQLITNHANRDFLTGLYNRRYFFENTNTYFNEAVAISEPFAIAMVDIDHFKNVNDTYGHDAGDKAIVNLSEILRAGVDRNDLVARFGGEEFCIVLKNISGNNALEVMERIRNNVKNSVTITDKGEEITFTISIGIALNHEETLEDTINEADMLLYNAKQNGRDQVVSN